MSAHAACLGPQGALTACCVATLIVPTLLTIWKYYGPTHHVLGATLAT